MQPYIPDKLTEKSANDIIVGFTDGQKQTFLNYYEKEGEIFVLKGAEELNSEEKIEIYDLISPHYYKELRYYGFWSYPAITEMEYLNRFSGDRKICEYALEKKFTKVLIIKSDKDNNSQAQTLSCVE